MSGRKRKFFAKKSESAPKRRRNNNYSDGWRESNSTQYRNYGNKPSQNQHNSNRFNNDSNRFNDYNQSSSNDFNADTRHTEDPELPALLDYFANIEYVLDNQSFENSEEESLFVEKVITELDNTDSHDPMLVFLHPTLSRVLQKFIDIISPFYLRRIIHRFILDNIEQLSRGRCSTHVLQSILSRIPRILVEEASLNNGHSAIDGSNAVADIPDLELSESKTESKVVPTMAELLVTMCDNLMKPTVTDDADNTQSTEFGKAGIVLFMHEIATFVIRDLLWITAGVVRFHGQCNGKKRMLLHQIRKIPNLPKFGAAHVPESVRLFAAQLAELLLSQNVFDLSTRIFDNNTSATIKVLIECLFITEQQSTLDKLCLRIIRCNNQPLLLKTLESSVSDQTQQSVTSTTNTALSKSAKKKLKKQRQLRKKQNIADSTETEAAEEVKQEPTDEMDFRKESVSERIKSHVSLLTSHSAASHIMQTMFEFCSPAIASFALFHFYSEPLRLLNMSLHPSANHVLQSLLRRLNAKNDVSMIVDAFNDKSPQLLKRNRIGVLSALVDASLRVDIDTEPLISSIVEAVYSSNKATEIAVESETKIGITIHKLLYYNLNSDKRKRQRVAHTVIPLQTEYSSLGCVLLKSLVCGNGDSSKELQNAFLKADNSDLTTDMIKNLCKDSSASHVIQALLEHKRISDIEKWHLLDRLYTQLPHIAISKCGNFVLEAAFNNLTVPFKKKLGECLLKKSQILKGSRLGIQTYHRMRLQLLEKSPDNWKQWVKGGKYVQQSTHNNWNKNRFSKQKNWKQFDSFMESKTKQRKPKNKNKNKNKSKPGGRSDPFASTSDSTYFGSKKVKKASKL